MPQVTKQIMNTAEVDVGFDMDGNQVEIGDYVTITLKVTRVRPIIHPETVQEVGQHLELGREKETGFIEHFLVCDSKICRKVMK